MQLMLSNIKMLGNVLIGQERVSGSCKDVQTFQTLVSRCKSCVQISTALVNLGLQNWSKPIGGYRKMRRSCEESRKHNRTKPVSVKAQSTPFSVG